MAEAQGDDIWLLDLEEFGDSRRTGAYLILGPEPTLIETGSARCHDQLVAELAAVGLRPEDLRHVVVTHVHLDHAGGAGHLMARAPHALLHCHPRAARHLVDPERLWQGAMAVYGAERLRAWFGRPEPVAPQRVVVEGDGARLALGTRTLTFYDTPGHARHHLGVVDDQSRGLFSGDTVSIRFDPALTGWPEPYWFPSTTPVDFDPPALFATLDRLEALGLDVVFHTHFGATRPAAHALAETRRGLGAILAVLEQVSRDAPADEVARRLEAVVRRDVQSRGWPEEGIRPLALDLELNAQGMLVYLARQAQRPHSQT
ncbi:MAG: MBL fold metallo-hydrolase [Firmicutes bacterium]|nr:MBL fold metallo-hydrolase [Alicyclobacillaceae bacterium]MCL6498063.1 MBL fold metallo-hydrolase [Bacillota bacterium]